MARPALVLGIDIGATSTRAVIVDTGGRLHGRGRGRGANLTAHTLDDALAEISTAIRAALATVDDAASVRQAVIGSAGQDNFKAPNVARAFDEMWRAAGLECAYEIVGDPEVAFVAGTSQPDGTLILAGTGALAAGFTGRRRMHTVDGHGWLLGDLGSGFWIGREAVRVALTTFDRLERPGPLVRAVLTELVAVAENESPGWERLGDDPTGYRDVASSLVMCVHARPPVALAALAPLVTAAFDADPQAAGIVRQAAEHLFTAALTVRTPGADTPIVLAGSLLTSDTPLRGSLQPQLAERWPAAPVTQARDGASGAAWLAAGRLLGFGTPESTRLHAQMLSGW